MIISTNGNVRKANWEIIGNNQLLIGNNNESILFNKGFIDKEMLILQKDNTQDFFFFVNNELYQKGISSINQIIIYLTEKYNVANPKPKFKSPKEIVKITTYIAKLKSGTNILIEKGIEPIAEKGKKVFSKNHEILPDGEYYLQNDKKIIVKSGKIENTTYFGRYKIKGLGEIVIHQKMKSLFQKGDFVTFNNEKINDGSYRISIFEKINIENGRISKIGII